MSLIVCTRERASRLEACFEALRGLKPTPGFELVFVDYALPLDFSITIKESDADEYLRAHRFVPRQ